MLEARARVKIRKHHRSSCSLENRSESYKDDDDARGLNNKHYDLRARFTSKRSTKQCDKGICVREGGSEEVWEQLGGVEQSEHERRKGSIFL